MQYRTLGSTGIEVSEIGFGGWTIGGSTESGGVPIGWAGVNDADALAAIRRARELGVNFFDTADVYGYGRSESLLGLALSRHRKSVIIATKVGGMLNRGHFIRDFSRTHIYKAVDGSLRRLRTDYIDLYQLHNPGLDILRREEAQEAMERLQDLGKIRFWGVAIGKPEEGIEIAKRGWGWTLQVLYNILNQAPARELFPVAREHRFGIIARVPLASGLLTGKFTRDTAFASDDVRQNFLTPSRLAEALEWVDEVKGIVGGSVRSLTEAALQFTLAQDVVATSIPGARNPHQVELNVAAAASRLPDPVVKRLVDRLGSYDFYHRHSIPL